MKEILLTEIEIQSILNKARFSILNNPGITKITKFPHDIMSITPIKKLIFIEGTKDTGLLHISSRHGFYTNSYSKKANGLFIETSKFESDSQPLRDYTFIAESLYSSENKDPNNKRPELFDVYVNEIVFPEKRKFMLICYKDTKIIHTIFPIIKGKPDRKLRKGDIIVDRVNLNTYIGLIPYFDIHDQIQYGIGITISLFEKIEKWIIIIYEDEKPVRQVNLNDQSVNYTYNIEFRFQELNVANVTNIEKIIEDLENGIIT